MREIKFRFYDEKTKKMICHDEIFYSGAIESHNKKRIQLMQFTGLPDKNGKDIYEGDIVLIREGIAVITFYCGSFWCSFWTLLLLSDRGVEVEVIGNIYETPDLIAG